MASILAISKSPVDPSREADDAASEPSVDAEITQRSFERQRTIRRETMPNERLTIADRTLSSSLPLRTRTGSLIFRSAEQDAEAPLDERTELERQDVPASIHVPGRDEDTDQVGRSPTTAFEADSEPFALHMYQRMAEEPSEEELEPESQSATSVGVNNLEEPAGQFERASTANVTFDPELLALDVYQRIAEEPLEEDSEAESQSAIASTNVNVIEATSSRIQRAPTANVLSNPNSFALRVYQRIADEPLGEEPEPNAIAPTNSNSTEDMTSQIERAPTTQVSRTVEPLEHVKARSPTGTMPPVERRATQTSPGYPANIPRAVTIARDVERKQSSAAPDQLDRALTMRSSPALEPLVYIDPEGLPSKTVPLERMRTQASPELPVDVPRASTIPLESNRRRSSAAQGFTPSARGSEPSVHSSAEAVLDETPQVQGRLRVAPTEPRTTDRRRSSAAPGITASPPQTILEGIEVGAQTKSQTKKPKQGANYPPEQQYPPAPAYPLRETPSWTKPDTRTPSPKVKAESPPKKRGWLNLGAKPEEESSELEGIKSRQSSQPALDPSEVQPFLDAAPGSPEAPGGTQKRQNSYPNQTRQATYRRDSSAPPIRRADTRTRQPSVYANKGDYYPVSPILPDRIDNGSQLQPSPSRRNSYSIPHTPVASRQGPLAANRNLKELSTPKEMLQSVPEHPRSKLSWRLRTRLLERVKTLMKKTFRNLSGETYAGRLAWEAQSQKRKQRPKKELSRLRHDRNFLQFPRKKARQTKESQIIRRAGFRNCLVLKWQGDKSKNKSQQHEPKNKGGLKWLWKKILRLPTPRLHMMKTYPPAVASIAQADPSKMTMPGSTARSTSRAQRPSQDHPPEMKVIEDFQVQTQKKRKSHEQTLVVQPQDECLIPQQLHNLHEKTQQPPREGYRRQSRGRTRGGSHQQSEKTEQRQSSQNYQRSPEHRHDRRRSPQYLDKPVSGEGLPLLEGVQQSPQKLCQTFKPDQQRKAAQDQPRGKSPEVRPRLSRYNQVDGHLLQLEQVRQSPERRYQNLEPQGEGETDLCRPHHKARVVQCRQSQLTTGEILLPEYNHRKVHWVQPSAQTRSQNNKPSQAHEQNQAMLSQQCRAE
ncbi:uncharacterized protein J4E84_009600 [Alternaria hordeiaustralica]|uniref:uncharacterized protein n=1 Tax=Alternaria hordeiaustralica TaxID=1187925 RepID=UPI0020C44B64|nr:uncharacterized protein J4E84_009600 [Alternaria hordeiaustralica]KAI4676203.1 hypothetical protein J4E84_009600 [Alternaria hordeiaustralica]